MIAPTLRLLPTLAAVATLALAGCGGSTQAASSNSTSSASVAVSSAAASVSGSAHAGHGGSGAATVVTDSVTKLADGASAITMGLPDGPYTPHAPAGGTDDYHCQLLDPKLTADTYLTGFTFQPGNPGVVHHAILFRVPQEAVASVQAKDAETTEPGWTCFGDAGIPQSSDNRVMALNNARWLGAWAPGGKGASYPSGTGVPLAAGTRIVLQVHYNLLVGNGADSSGVTLTTAKPGTTLKALHTMLMPAPVDMPCTATQSGPLCDRTAAMGDLATRFGPDAAARVGGLDLLCGVDPVHPVIGNTQVCTRPVKQPMTVVSLAGHMHLMGKSIKVDKIDSAGTVTNLLDIPVWNFDDQSARRLSKPEAFIVGDKLRVTCTHDASLRDMLPELKSLPDRHVLWGEGTSDEMCLGIVTYLQS